MSKLADLKSHIHSIEEIQSILNAMKNLSVVELNKVNKFITNQNKIVEVIDDIIGDFFKFYPVPELQNNSKEITYILVGSERGFCGAFNEKVIEFYEELTKSDSRDKNVIFIGRKLESKFPDIEKSFQVLDGPSVVEDIPRIVQELKNTLAMKPGKKVITIYNKGSDSDFDTIGEDPFNIAKRKNLNNYNDPPLLYLDKNQFRKKLYDQFVEIELFDMVLKSFLVENKERLKHMEGAIDQIDKQIDYLNIKKNSLRQSEITQELEIILLNTVLKY